MGGLVIKLIHIRSGLGIMLCIKKLALGGSLGLDSMYRKGPRNRSNTCLSSMPMEWPSFLLNRPRGCCTDTICAFFMSLFIFFYGLMFFDIMMINELFLSRFSRLFVCVHIIYSCYNLGIPVDKLSY